MTESRLQKTKASTEALVSETVAALCSTKTKIQASQLLGISEEALYDRLRNHPEISKAVAKIPELALTRLKASSYKAAGVLINNLDDRKNQMQAASTILDRVGAGTSKSNVNVEIFQPAPLLGGASNMQVNFLDWQPDATGPVVSDDSPDVGEPVSDKVEGDES